MKHAEAHELPPLTTHPECGCGVYAVPQGFDLFKLKGQIGASFTIDMQNDMAKHLIIAMIQELEYTFATLAVNGMLGTGKILTSANPDKPPADKGKLPSPSELEGAIQDIENFLNTQKDK